MKIKGSSWRVWIFAVICMFTALMCHIEWTHITTREHIAIFIECIDIHLEALHGNDVTSRVQHLKKSLERLGTKAPRLLEAMPYINSIK